MHTPLSSIGAKGLLRTKGGILSWVHTYVHVFWVTNGQGFESWLDYLGCHQAD